MSETPIPCKRCKQMPTIDKIEGAYYARCPTRCNKWHRFEHLGLTLNACIRNWNRANSRNAIMEDDDEL